MSADLTAPARREEAAEGSFGELLGRAASMRALFRSCAELAASELTLLISGEAGTGKDMLARCLHRASPRAQASFVTFECSAVAPSALDAELFGQAGRAGAIERARGGTLLLDELSELPLSVQGRLLDALSRESGTRAIRLLVSSKRRLAGDVERGRLLPELQRAVAQAELTLPPLRDRREDIPLLAQHFLGQLGEGEQPTLSRDALELLALHDWPGNVRELRNVVERLFYAVRAGGAAARRVGALLLTGELPAIERRSSPALEPTDFEPGLSYREQRARFEAAFEQRYVAWLLERHDGNVSAAARAADMDRKYLDKLARKHALKPGPG